MFNLIPSIYKIIGIIAVTLGLVGTFYYLGYTRAKTAADLEFIEYIKAAENRVKTLEKQLDEKKIEIVTEYVDRVITVKEKEYVYIDKSKNVPSKCELSTGWVHLHDSAARGTEPDSAGVTDATPSGIKDNQALGTIVSNYSVCEQNAQQLKSLQDWVRSNQKIIEEGSNK